MALAGRPGGVERHRRREGKETDKKEGEGRLDHGGQPMVLEIAVMSKLIDIDEEDEDDHAPRGRPKRHRYSSFVKVQSRRDSVNNDDNDNDDDNGFCFVC